MRRLIWMMAGAIALCIVVGIACGVFLKRGRAALARAHSRAFWNAGWHDKLAQWRCQPLRKRARIPSRIHRKCSRRRGHTGPIIALLATRTTVAEMPRWVNITREPSSRSRRPILKSETGS
jgi:hypothetical protein